MLTKQMSKQYAMKLAMHTTVHRIRDGIGQDFLDPTGKFQNLRRFLTGQSTNF